MKNFDWTAIVIFLRDHGIKHIHASFVGNTFAYLDYIRSKPRRTKRLRAKDFDEMDIFILAEIRASANEELTKTSNQYQGSDFFISTKDGKWRHAGRTFNYTGKIHI